MLVSIDEAKQHLRIDGNDDNTWLTLWIDLVSDAVLSWLKDPGLAFVEDSSGSPVPVPVVKAAVLVELAQQYRFRDGKDAASLPPGYILGAGATNLLSGIRRPTVA